MTQVPPSNDNHQMQQEPEPSPPSEPILNLPSAIKWLCGLIILIHLGTEYLPEDIVEAYWIKLAFVPARYTTQELIWLDPAASLLSPIGHSLLHANWMHLFSNIGMFLAFGTGLYRLVGTERLLFVWCFSAIAGAAAFGAVDQNLTNPMIGASSAISGVLGALLYFSWKFAKLGIPAAIPFATKERIMSFLCIWVGINFLFILVPTEGRIAWEAHLGGLIAGVIAAYILILFRPRRKESS